MMTNLDIDNLTSFFDDVLKHENHANEVASLHMLDHDAPFVKVNVTAEDIVVGVFYIVSSSFFISIFICVLIVVWRDEDLMRKSCYKIMVSMGCADLVQLFYVGIVAGSYTISGSVHSFLFNKVMGGILNASWITTSVMASTLAIDRFLVINFKHFHPTVLGGKKPWFWIAGCICYGGMFFCAYMSPGIEVIYLLDFYTYDYNYEFETRSRVCWTVELSSNCTHNTIMFLCYLGIGIRLRANRKMTSGGKLGSKEKKALLQSFLMCTIIMMYVSVWFGISALSRTKAAMAMMEVIWILMSGMNGLFYIIFNKAIRKDFVALLHLQKVAAKIALTGKSAKKIASKDASPSSADDQTQAKSTAWASTTVGTQQTRRTSILALSRDDETIGCNWRNKEDKQDGGKWPMRIENIEEAEEFSA